MKITLQEWGSRNYNPAPSIRILRAWASSGQIFPTPEKVGRTIMVDETAIRTPLPIIINNATNDTAMSSRARAILNAA